MITIRRANVERLVTSKQEATKFIAQGFEFVDAESEKQSETSVFVCPHCSKEYKTAEGLEKHLQKEHSQNGGDKNDTGANSEDNSGNQDTQ